MVAGTAGNTAGDTRPATVWNLGEPDPAASERIRRELALHPAVARLLVQRGIAEPDDARRFLRPSLADLHDPLLLADLEPAVERLLQAVATASGSSCTATTTSTASARP